MALSDMQKKANKLGIKYEAGTSDVDLEKLVVAEEARLEAEKEDIRVKKENLKNLNKAVKTAEIILKNTRGEDVDQKDYFYPGVIKDAQGKDTGEISYAKPWFHLQCGMPVEDQDLLVVFDKMFDPSENFLLYKVPRKEIYVVIVPLRHAHTIGHAEDSLPGDFQKHAMSFIMEGSVNVDTFKIKLKKIRDYIRKSE